MAECRLWRCEADGLQAVIRIWASRTGSQLTHVFGRLLYENRLSEEDLRGLREEKLKSIRSLAKFLAESAA